MNINDIPFNRYLKIQPSEGQGGLAVEYALEMTNHLGSMHASVQFALAEACSGKYMLDRFPEYTEGYVAVLGRSNVKYKSQTREGIHGVASSDEENVGTFRKVLERRHRAILPVTVVIKDVNGVPTMEGAFDWYVQKVEEED